MLTFMDNVVDSRICFYCYGRCCLLIGNFVTGPLILCTLVCTALFLSSVEVADITIAHCLYDLVRGSYKMV